MRSVRVMLIALGVLVLMVLLPAMTAAWDSWPPDTSSHWYFVRDAVSDLLSGDASKYSELKTYLDQLHEGSNYEGSHSVRRDPNRTIEDYEYWAGQAVGNNPGTNHPEYWWQTALHHYRKWVTTGDEGERREAYLNLGRLIHLISDQGVPAHAYYIMHGGAHPDNFEVLAVLNYKPDYYKKPKSDNYPGKNVLDVGRHGDNEHLTRELKIWTGGWVHIFDTNLQVPGAREVEVRLDVSNPVANPCFYLKFEYDTVWGWSETVESGEVCVNYFSTKILRWTDSFAPNTTLKVSYRRPESGSNRDVQFKIYVRETEDVSNEIHDPCYVNPWEYYDWLRRWTLWATQADYWRRYYNDGYRGDLEFDVLWASAPNTERALLSLQDRVTREAVKWALEAATVQFEHLRQNPNSVTDKDALGLGYRVVIYDDANYNSTSSESPEYIKSLPLACEQSCGKLAINDLGWMGGIISSLEVRGARVTLYSGKDLTGGTRVFDADTSYVGADFNDKAWSLKIEPTQAVPATPEEAVLPVHIVGGVESSPTAEGMLEGALWVGADTRPQTPRILEGVLQFDLANALPADATIIGAELELTGGSAEYLTPGAGGEWWVDLMDNAADEGWPEQVTYWRIHSALIDLSLEPRLSEAELAEGQVYTFPIDEYHAQRLTWRLRGDGKASFRVSSSGPSTPARTRHIFGFQGWGDGASVLRVWYTVP